MTDASTPETGITEDSPPVGGVAVTSEQDTPLESDRPVPSPRKSLLQGWSARLGAAVSRHRKSLLALFAYLIAGVMLTEHLWSDPAGLRIARNPDDTDLYQWWFGWWMHSLATWQDPFITYAMNMPTGVSLMANTSMPLPAIATSWLDALAGPLVVYNVLSALAPALSGWAAYLCATRFGVRPAVAFVGGLVFGFSSAIVYSLLGHISMALVPLLPILVLLNVLAWRTRCPRRVGLALGAAALAQVFTGEEVLFQAGVATLIILVVLAASRPQLIRPALPNALRAYGWALALFVPIAAYPLYVQFFGPLKMHGSPFWADYYAADLGAFTTPSELNWRGPGLGADKFPGGITEHLAYLGWPLVIFCLATILARWSDLRVRAAGVGLAVAGIFSMGGTLWVRGQQTEQTLPWGWFKELPVLEGALPSRFGLLTALFAAAVVAFGLQALVEHPRRVAMRGVAVAVVAALCWTLAPGPLAVEPVDEIPAYFTTEARQLPAGTKALVVPFPRPHQTEPLRWQTAAGYTYDAPGGYFIAPGWDGHAYIGGAAGQTQQLLAAVEEKGEPLVVTPQLRAAVRAELVDWGIDIAILGPSERQTELRQIMTQLFEKEPRAVGDVLIWDRP